MSLNNYLTKLYSQEILFLMCAAVNFFANLFEHIDLPLRFSEGDNGEGNQAANDKPRE